MTSGEATTAVAAPHRAGAVHEEWLDRRWRLMGLLLSLIALATAALLVTTGMRPASYADLLGDVSSGAALEVEVVAAADLAEGDEVELRWKVLGDVLDQYTTVVIGDGRGYNTFEESVFVSSVDPRETLRSINDGVQITRGSTHDAPSFSFMEWRASGPVTLLALVTWLAVLLLLVGGPEPWRATRWAWGWAWLLTGPLGSVAYLLLGGPLGLLRPAARHRRLTGGLAFLLAWMLFAGWRERNGW